MLSSSILQDRSVDIFCRLRLKRNSGSPNWPRSVDVTDLVGDIFIFLTSRMSERFVPCFSSIRTSLHTSTCNIYKSLNCMFYVKTWSFSFSCNTCTHPGLVSFTAPLSASLLLLNLSVWKELHLCFDTEMTASHSRRASLAYAHPRDDIYLAGTLLAVSGFLVTSLYKSFGASNDESWDSSVTWYHLAAWVSASRYI